MATAKTAKPATVKPTTDKITTNTAGAKMPNPKKATKSAKASAQTLKAATKATTKSAATATNVVPLKRDEIVAQIETLKADLATLTNQLKTTGVEYVDAKTADVRAAATEKAVHAKDVALEKAELAKDKYAELAADTEARIRQNPLTAVAIAAGVGLLFGAVSRR